VVVHILHYGSPLCRFSERLPAEWTPDHTWVGLHDPDALKDVNCPKCAVEMMKRRLEDMKSQLQAKS
jgi:hypothetical protein